MYCKLVRLGFLCIFYSFSLQAVVQQEQPQSNIFVRALSGIYTGITDALKYPFKAMGSATVDGALENIQQRLQPRQQVLPGGLVNPEVKSQDAQMKEIVNTFFKALSAATDSKDKEAAGAQFMKNLFKNGAIALGDLYNPDGEGREALRKIINTLKDYINEDGVMKALIEDMRNLAVDEVRILFEHFEALNLDGGAAHRAVRAAAQNVRGGVEEVGDALDDTSQKVVRNVLIGGVLLISSWFLWRHIDRNLRTPALVLETSHKNYLQRFLCYLWGSTKKEKPRMICSPELTERLDSVALAARMIHEKIIAGQKNIRYRNLLLWGPPGTGKTMFARILAEHSDMDYVIMSGASFSQYRGRGEGISHMNKLFEWAQNTPTGGLILFIDEAEAFLGGRLGADISSESYQLLTNFLNLTGERSNKVMLVFGTNHPEVLDEAMKRRIDDSIEIPLPAEHERLGILALYRDKLMLDPIENSPEFIESVQKNLSDTVLSDLAYKTDGLSGGEIEGIINSLISDASIREDGLITPELIVVAVDFAMQKHVAFEQGFNH